MSLFRINVVAKNPKDEAQATPPIEVLVDTGSELTWLPGELLRSAGIEPRRTRTFTMATGQVVQRSVGCAVLGTEGHETIDEVVFGEKGDLHLLGVRTLEGFGVVVDPLGHRGCCQYRRGRIAGPALSAVVASSTKTCSRRGFARKASRLSA